MSRAGLDDGAQVLFIGDSYTQGVSSRFAALSAARTPAVALTVREIADGNTSLFGHSVKPRTMPVLRDGDWDLVVLQDDLEYYDWDAEEMAEAHRTLQDEIQQIGARTILYLSWKSEDTDTVRYQKMIDAYVELGRDLGIDVAPVGPAWARAMAERPELDLYADDRSHSSLAGVHLAVAVIWATAFGESPEGVRYAPDEPLRGSDDPIQDDDLDFLHRIAWETVEEFRAAAG